MTLAAIPSPSTAVWYAGPIPIRAYALFIVLGIVVACVVTEYRLRARGVHRYAVLDLAVWAVPFGIVGARVYHVITSPRAYFGADGELIRVFFIHEGGLGIWGAIAGGAVGVWLGCRQLKIPFLLMADAAAVGIPLAQAVGRLGNWFNNELYGSETTLPWGLQVYQMSGGQAQEGPDGEPLLVGDGEVLFHPTFLYEALWNVGVALLVLFVSRQVRLGRGRAFALYVMGYTAGRFWIEMLRIDDTAEQPGVDVDTVTTLFGQRINVWVAAAVFLLALAYFLRLFPLARGEPEYVLPADPERGEAGGYRVVTVREFVVYRPPAAEPGEPSELGEPSDLGESGESGAPDESGEPGSGEPVERPADGAAEGSDIATGGSDRPRAAGDGA